MLLVVTASKPQLLSQNQSRQNENLKKDAFQTVGEWYVNFDSLRSVHSNNANEEVEGHANLN